MSFSFASMDWKLEAQDDDLESLRSSEVDLSAFQRLSMSRLDPNKHRRLIKFASRNREALQLTTRRIAILSDANMEFYVDALRVEGFQHGLDLEFKIIEYGEVLAQVSSPESDLYRFAPEFVVLALFGARFQDALVNVAIASEMDVGASLQSELKLCLDCLSRHSKAQIVLQTLPEMAPALFGQIEFAEARSLGFSVRSLNQWIMQRGLPFIDAAQLSAQIGLHQWFDPGKYHWAKLPFSPSCLPNYADRFVRKVSLLNGKIRKCLVLDLDNTLWGGVIGDDGVEGIKLGQNSPEGEAFLSGQRFYKMLGERGIVLAICSKNDLENAMLPFERHPEMVLQKSDFACIRANWQNKPDNLREIADALSLSVDSFVFLDDNPAEREFVRRELPEVAVPEVPNNDASLYPRIIEAAGYFDTLSVTSADVARARDYRANADRQALRAGSSDVYAYLRDLGMTATISTFSPVNIERIVQLINRSNQFNLTTRRYTFAEIEQVMAAEDARGLTIHLSDRFSDAGIVAVTILRNLTAEAWDIDTWLMSCRVLGRQVEEATLLKLCELASSNGIRTLVGRYLESPKNSMVRDHYKKLGFSQIEEEQGKTVWECDVQRRLSEFAGADPLPFSFVER